MKAIPTIPLRRKRIVPALAWPAALGLIALLPFATAAAAKPEECHLAIDETSCDYAANPLGIEDPHPRLSWRLRSRIRSQYQAAYQIQVSSEPGFPDSAPADLWDSGKVISDQSIQVPFAGKPLRSRQRCYWRVRVWDRQGVPSEFSPGGSWEMGLLAPSDWRAEWIGFPAGWEGRALYFRHGFEVAKPVKGARAYISGLGYYELRLNGEKVGDHVLDPGWTDYGRRVLYATYDIGSRLLAGANMVGVIAGHGWYGTPKLKLQIEIEYLDGTRELVATEGGSTKAPNVWSVSGGAITRNGIYDGETYDARLEKAGWDSPPGPNPPSAVERVEDWATAVPVDPPAGKLRPQTIEPIRVIQAFRPRGMSQPRPGIYVFDAGQNLAGWAALEAEGPPGTEIKLRFAENLNPDGTVNQENLRTAAAFDVYILKGAGKESWEPRFTYHGFRYVQVEGFPGRPALANLRIKRVRSDVPENGSFSCGNDLLNRIQRMVVATEASNLYSVPTDCPQRNERMGWLNDMTVRAEEAVYNFRMGRFYGKWIDDIADTQTPAGAIADTAPYRWGKRPADPVCASYFLLAWLSYLHYGDPALIREHYASFNKWIDYLVSRADNFIVTYSSWGDWSPPRAFAVTGSIGSGAISAGTPGELMSTGSLYYQIKLLARMAGVLGRAGEVRRLDGLAGKVAQAFNGKYWNEGAGGYGSNNQACNAFALYIAIVPAERRMRVLKNLSRDVERNGGHLSTGNLCTKFLFETLAAGGRGDLAYRVATQRTYPSWGFMLENGATTLWERWEELTGGGMNSHNHPMMGSVSSWFFKYLGGIQVDPSGPGFARFLVRPFVPADLGWAETSYRSLQGPIRSAWRKEGTRLTMEISVPVNSTATVYVPADTNSRVREGDLPADKAEGVKYLRSEAGSRVFEIGSGDYEFTSAPSLTPEPAPK